MSSNNIVRYGYYIPAQDLMYGDIAFAQQAKDLYQTFGLNHKYACSFDGVSVIEYEDCSVKREYILRDFICELCKESVLGGRVCSANDSDVVCRKVWDKKFKRGEIFR